MGSASSGDAIRINQRLGGHAAVIVYAGSRKPTEDFGSLTFNEEVQRARLPKEVFRVAAPRHCARRADRSRRSPTSSPAR